MKRIRKGDRVVVLAGKDRGKVGSVQTVLGSGRLVIENVNMVKRHTKPNPQANQPGGILTKEASIDASNVALYNPQTKKADKIGFKSLEDGTKVRFYRSTGEVVDA